MTMNAHRLECDAILFDLDGVLIDSTSCVIRHWKRFADQHGLDLDMIMQAAHGVRTIETIRLVAPHLDAEQETAQFTAREVADTDGVHAIEGARRLLDALPEDAWAVVTSGGQALAKARLMAGGLPVPRTLVTADDVVQGKPAPEPYLVGAKRLGLAAKRCVVIEDAPAGIASGKGAGMRVIGVASTHGHEELLAAGADAVARQLTDLTIRPGTAGRRLLVRVSLSRPGEPMAPAKSEFPPGVAKPALRALASAGITDLDQVTRFTETELLALHGMGPKALGILKEALRAQDKALAESPAR
jgi:sugar-phosphatase